MNIDEIINRKNSLNEQLIQALSSMSLSNRVKEIRAEIKANQENCPHVSNKYNWTITQDGFCPYCGIKMEEQ